MFDSLFEALGKWAKTVDWGKVARGAAITAAVVGGAATLAKNARDSQLIEKAVDEAVTKRLPHEIK